MRQIKIFHGDARDSSASSRLEVEVNKWLAEHAGVSIVRISMSQAGEYGQHTNVLVDYVPPEAHRTYR